jgi:transketolase
MNSSSPQTPNPGPPELTNRATHEELVELATRIRLLSLRMVQRLGLGYLGQALSSAELFAVIFGELLSDRDRFVLSPGHYGTPYYAASIACGRLEESLLDGYGDDGGLLEAISSEQTPGVDFTCGSLGQGLSAALGLALGERLSGSAARTIALVSDGELEEGQLWEAAMFAGHQQLDSVLVLLDANGSQVDGPVSSVTTIEPIAAKWEAFGWCTREVDGHDVDAIVRAARELLAEQRPGVLIARTDILGHIDGLADGTDGHFIKIVPGVAEAITAASVSGGSHA